jgi:hypothetical protein
MYPGVVCAAAAGVDGDLLAIVVDVAACVRESGRPGRDVFSPLSPSKCLMKNECRSLDLKKKKDISWLNSS